MGLALTQPPLKAGVDATAVSAWICERFFGAASRQSIRVRTPRLASDAPVIVGHAVFEDRCRSGASGTGLSSHVPAMIVSASFRIADAFFRQFGCVGSVSADQLAHARPSMTQDASMGRKVVDARVAEALEDALGKDQSRQGSAKKCEYGVSKVWVAALREGGPPPCRPVTCTYGAPSGT